ncbi:MAG: DUF2953 domain-containing protein [Oscillospiraceae bacterium]|nr:DUF2953 domain-containing protein [Oscillospiraceae bacterium]
MTVCGESHKLKAKSTVEDYIVIISVLLFNKVRAYSKTIGHEETKHIKEGKLLEWINKKLNTKIQEDFKDISKFILRERKRIFRRETWERFRDLRMEVTKLKIDMEVGTENPVVTAYLTAAIASMISIILAYNVRKERAVNYKYKVIPAYINQNFLKMKLNCIIDIKMIHIINIIYMILRKRNDEEYDEASTREIYTHRHEQYSK